MKGRRIVFSSNLNLGKYNALDEQAHLLGKTRSQVWQGFGSIYGVGVNHRTVRTDWVKNRDFSPLPAKAWKETLKELILLQIPVMEQPPLLDSSCNLE